jgi:hypothetical protein
LTISGTGGADYGDYLIDITGTAFDMVRGTIVGLGLFSAAPSAPGLVSPSDGAVEVSVIPTLQWAAAAQAVSYEVEVATDPTFADIVYAATADGTSHDVETALETLTGYSWRVRASNACGVSDDSVTFSFTTQDMPSVLLVDDDDNNPNVQSYYADALSALGVWHDVWDTGNSDNEPTAQDLAPYEAVIWFTGDEFGGACGPGSAGETALAAWMADGGCLLLSSQDYYFDRGLTEFMASYLGVLAVDSDVDQSTVTGAGTVFGGMGPYGLSYPFSNYSDRITPRGGADAVAFTGTAGDAAIFNDGTVHRSALLGFPIEAIADPGDRSDVLLTFFDWCGGLGGSCTGDVDEDGIVGILDLLDLLAAWGPNPDHPADLDGDGEVGITDFLELLAAWGPCP